MVVGARGKVGTEVAHVLGAWAEVVRAGRGPGDEQRVDLLDAPSVEAALERVRPDVVVNAAAYVAVDQAEQEPAAAHALNGLAPGLLARACDARGALLVHVGSDYVFDGALGRPYREEDAPRPLSVYGRSKWEGEQAVLAAQGPHLVLRTSWVYAHGRPCWLSTFERLLRGPGPLRAVSDQWGSPTWAVSFAQAVDAMLQRLRGIGPRGDLEPRAVRGLYHVVDGQGATWFELACAVKQILGLEAEVVAVPRASMAQPAPRPPDSRLATGRVEAAFGLRLPTWRESLARCLRPPPA
jgi:dTDP-4-dehydrorhamnose reductase